LTIRVPVITAERGIAMTSRLAVCLSVTLGYRVSWSHRLEYFENNFTAGCLGCSLFAYTPASRIYYKGNTQYLGRKWKSGYWKSGFRRTKKL